VKEKEKKNASEEELKRNLLLGLRTASVVVFVWSLYRKEREEGEKKVVMDSTLMVVVVVVRQSGGQQKKKTKTKTEE
jgi:hypothetical protein